MSLSLVFKFEINVRRDKKTKMEQMQMKKSAVDLTDLAIGE